LTLTELQTILASVPVSCPLSVDTEHLPDAEPGLDSLLGISLCWPGSNGVYIPLNHWVGVPSKSIQPMQCQEGVRLIAAFLAPRLLDGWNVTHDKLWLDAAFAISTKWDMDGRVAWYLLDREQSPKDIGYGLKRAQVKILGYAEAGDAELRAEVMKHGGNLDDGDHYLATLASLSRYAAVDAKSTFDACAKFRSEMDDSDWYALRRNMEYAQFLAESEQAGVVVDEVQLKRAEEFYKKAVVEAKAEIRSVCAPEIAVIEQRLVASSGLADTRPETLAKRAESTQKKLRFNPGSSAQRSILFHELVGIPVVERSKKTGAPKSDKKTIAKFDHPSAKAFVKLSEMDKARQFATQYLQHAKAGRLHFPLDTTGTVSERLGGRAPYCLNMPFTREPIMQAFKVDPGCIGIHMDWVSVEPCLIAGFSGDPTLLKVYRDGLGDVYLDLCLDMFPLAEASVYGPELETLILAFHAEYDTNKPPQAAQKAKFDRIRKVAKIIHLAVQYTGTEYTVSKNLTQAGFTTSVDKARDLLYRYWNRFSNVATLSHKLKSIVERRGYLTGLFGRKLWVPKKLSKDALNRFGQHGGHAILREVVLEINKHKLEGMRPLLPDLHDATSWCGPEHQADEMRRVFEDAIRRVNDILKLPVTVAGDIKLFKTFYGLKNREDLE